MGWKHPLASSKHKSVQYGERWPCFLFFFSFWFHGPHTKLYIFGLWSEIFLIGWPAMNSSFVKLTMYSLFWNWFVVMFVQFCRYFRGRSCTFSKGYVYLCWWVSTCDYYFSLLMPFVHAWHTLPWLLKPFSFYIPIQRFSAFCDWCTWKFHRWASLGLAHVDDLFNRYMLLVVTLQSSLNLYNSPGQLGLHLYLQLL